jgi:hypothetical protein
MVGDDRDHYSRADRRAYLHWTVLRCDDCFIQRAAQMTKRQIQTLACALFHDGLDVDKLSARAKAELRAGVATLLAVSRPDTSHNQGAPHDTK